MHWEKEIKWETDLNYYTLQNCIWSQWYWPGQKAPHAIGFRYFTSLRSNIKLSDDRLWQDNQHKVGCLSNIEDSQYRFRSKHFQGSSVIEVLLWDMYSQDTMHPETENLPADSQLRYYSLLEKREEETIRYF